MVSVIVPILNEEKYIARCIDSILLQDYPKDDLEIIFSDGMSTDKTREIIIKYAERYPFIRLVDNPHITVPYAMNEGILAAKGEIIIRLDGHVEYPTNYFSSLVKYLRELKADNVGGLCNTLPCNSSNKAIAIAKALSCPFGMGNSYFRIGCNQVKEVDTVPFGCFPRSLFDRIGLYDEELTRNQDDELNGRIIKNGGKIYLIPDIICRYYSRDKISKIARMFYQYGLFKPLVNKKLGSPATVRQFFPLLFVSGLVIGLCLCLLFSIWIVPYVSVLVLYIFLAMYFSIKSLLKEQKYIAMAIMPMVFITMHCSYGIGYLIGIGKILAGSNFNAKANR